MEYYKIIMHNLAEDTTLVRETYDNYQIALESLIRTINKLRKPRPTDLHTIFSNGHMQINEYEIHFITEKV